jgi:alpha-glucosidase (family GH31 glycosyl hydrolase)
MTRHILSFALVFFITACSDSSDYRGSAGEMEGLVVDAGSLRLMIIAAPWQMRFVDGQGVEILAELPDTGAGPFGSAGVFPGPPAQGSGSVPSLEPLEMGEPAIPPEREDGWVRATELVSGQSDGETWTGQVATTDPAIFLEVHASAQGDGIIGVSIRRDGSGVQASGIAFSASSEERFVGFGERGNAVNQAGNIIENYVAEGPYQDAEYPIMNVLIPPPGLRWRPDTTYFPIPWLLSSRGYGVLLDNDEMSYHRLNNDGAWAVEVESAELRFRVFAGPRPADALERFSAAIGRQPHDYAPWFFGPWVQSDYNERIDELREDDVPTSVTATYTHYLPCGKHRGREDQLREQTAARNAAGTAVHTYFNPMICVDFLPDFAYAEEQGALLRTSAGETYIYEYNTSSTFTVSQFDFSTDSGVATYKALTDEALEHGYEGWMEDFGEYTPLDAVSADGITGTQYHNRYARDYHCGVAAATADAGKPLARFARSGWTGSAACSPIVWGGDPTTGYGFDGLESSIYQALSMGTSGVGLWGSDIGGFFALFDNHLTAELFDRWIAFGAFSAVMRSERDGINLTPFERPHLWDPEHIDLWRKYAKLRTQLYPYLQAAAETYYATGMPIMRHHLLTHPEDAAAQHLDSQYLFGPDILVAPVFIEGDESRAVYLPEGEWAEWWRSVDYHSEDGSFALSRTTLHSGGAEITVDAPREEIPLFVRAGAVISLLAPDVYTLAEHGEGDPSVIRLKDREGQLHLLAFPRGESVGAFYTTGTYTSSEDNATWSLSLEDEMPRQVHLQASLRTLAEPFDPCLVTVGGTELDPDQWNYDASSGVLSAAFMSDAGALEASACL